LCRPSAPALAPHWRSRRNIPGEQWNRPFLGIARLWAAVKTLTTPFAHATSTHPDRRLPLIRSEIWRLEKYLRNLFRLDTITIVERPKQDDSVEVHVNGEFIGVIFKDVEDGETSYAFNMAILEMDLPEPPASRT
jgi:hypothetical protein